VKEKEANNKGKPDGENAYVYFRSNDADNDGNNERDQRKYGYHNKLIITQVRYFFKWFNTGRQNRKNIKNPARYCRRIFLGMFLSFRLTGWVAQASAAVFFWWNNNSIGAPTWGRL
jgi:hypothetical protein